MFSQHHPCFRQAVHAGSHRTCGHMRKIANEHPFKIIRSTFLRRNPWPKALPNRSACCGKQSCEGLSRYDTTRKLDSTNILWDSRKNRQLRANYPTQRNQSQPFPLHSLTAQISTFWIPPNLTKFQGSEFHEHFQRTDSLIFGNAIFRLCAPA